MQVVRPEQVPVLTAEAFKPPKGKDVLRIVPLGGCGEFGMNLTAYLTGGRLFVVDAGVMFPDPTKLGIDALVPKVDPFFEAAGGVYAYVITHGHEDHLGALPHLLRRWPAPVYATPWAASLLRRKIERYGGPDGLKIIEVSPGDKVATEGFEAEYIHVNHSIPMACSLAIRAGPHRVLHTGDFKCDDDPLGEPRYDLARFEAFGGEGVHLMLADSTGAHNEGRCPGEASVAAPLTDVIRKTEGACVLTTFSSNLWRLRTIVHATAAAGRRLVVSGAGLEQTLSIGAELGLTDIPDGVLVSEDHIQGLSRDRLVILATGCQAEWRASLARMAAGEHRTLGIQTGDRVVFSSRIIPGNERGVLGLTARLIKLGAEVITSRDEAGIHVSGHGYREDLAVLIRAVRPAVFMPVHGSFSHLKANHDLGLEVGGKAELVGNGDVFELKGGKLTLLGRVETEVDFVDAMSAVLMPREKLRERLRIGELGACLLTGVYDRKKRKWIVLPALQPVGIDLPSYLDKDSFVAEALAEVDRVVRQLSHEGFSTPDTVEAARIAVRRRLSRALNKKPVVLPAIQIV